MRLAEVEETVAGMVLRDPKQLAVAASMGLGPEHFAEPLTREVFAAARETWLRREAVDVVTVVRRVGAEHAAAVKALRRDAPITQNFEPFVQALLDSHHQAELMARLTEVGRMLTHRKPMQPLTPALEKLASLIAHCRGSDRAAKSTTMREALLQSTGEVEARIESLRVGLPPGVPTGIAILDRVIYGFQKGSVYILGARTSVGKTTMAVNMALAAGRAGHRVALFTVEMSDVDLVNKMLSKAARVTSERYLVGNMTDDEFNRINDRASELASLPITFVEVLKPTLETLEFEIMRLVQVEQVELVVVDYLQQFEIGDGRHRPPREEAKAVSTALKMMARSHAVPILVLSQLSRQAPENAEPELVHIAESDQIARDADVVMFLFRNGEHGPYCISVAKNRRGQKVAITLKAELEFSHFAQAPHER